MNACRYVCVDEGVQYLLAVQIFSKISAGISYCISTEKEEDEERDGGGEKRMISGCRSCADY